MRVLLLFGLLAPAIWGWSQPDTTEVNPGRLLYDEGVAALNLGELDSAAHRFEQAIVILEERGPADLWVDCYNGLFTVAYLRGDYRAGEAYGRKSLSLAEAHLRPEDPVYTATLNNLGALYYMKSDFRKAVEVQRKALAIKTENGEEAASIAAALQNIGHTYEQMGEYDEAISFLDRALALRRDSLSADQGAIAYLMLVTGMCWKEKGAYERALSILRRGAAAFEALSPAPGTANAIKQQELNLHLGELLFELGERKAASKIVSDLLSHRESLKAYTLLKVLQLDGRIALAQGRLGRSEAAFAEAVALAREQYGQFSKHTGIARSYLYQARLLVRREKWGDALHNYQQALIFLTPGFEAESVLANPDSLHFLLNPLALEVLGGKAAALRKEGRGTAAATDRLELAFQTYELALELTEKIQRSYLTRGSKARLLRQADTLFKESIELAHELYRRTGQEQYFNRAFAIAEQSKSNLLVESMDEASARSVAVPEALSERERALALDISFYERKILEEQSRPGGPREELMQDWRKSLFTLKQNYRELVFQLEARYPRYHALKYGRSVLGAEECRRLLTDDQTVLLSFFRGKSAFHLFFLSTTDRQWIVIDDARDIEKKVEALRQDCSRPSGQFDFRAFALRSHDLYRRLLGSLQARLAAPVRRLLVIPDGALAQAPFEVLLTEETREIPGQVPPYLLRSHLITYGYSATLLARGKTDKQKAEPASATFMGVAPQFGRSGQVADRGCVDGEQFALRCNQQEVSRIGRNWRGDTFLGDQATKAGFLERASHYRILHLATHACAVPEQPMLSKIFFSDGYLTNQELYQQELNAELVVLSACQTGAGAYLPGEGIMSLARGFTVAGCPSSVISLWSVDDCATAEIMDGLHRNLREGSDKDEALREAKLAYLAQADQLHRHPYYWAGFVHMGEYQALSGTRTRRWWPWWLGVGITLLIAGALIRWKGKLG